MNEALVALQIFVEFCFILFAARLGKRWLLLTIVLNMVLVSVMGAKVIDVFGFTTNAGNIFYASVFLAIQFLIEKHGRHEARRAVWYAVGGMAFFIALTQTVIHQSGPVGASDEAAESIRTLFAFVPRIAIASVVAFVVSQQFNIEIYGRLQEQTGRRLLWYRTIVAVAVGQAVDSFLFFFIAFSGVLPTALLFQTMIIGFVWKTLIGYMGMLALYADRVKMTRNGPMAG